MTTPKKLQGDARKKVDTVISEKTENTDAKERGELLRRFRKSYGVTLEELAARVQLSQPMLTRFETGSRNLSADAWTRVLVELGKIEKEKNTERAKASKIAVMLGLGITEILLSPFAGPVAREIAREKLEAEAEEIAKQEDALALSKEIGRQGAALYASQLETDVKKLAKDPVALRKLIQAHVDLYVHAEKEYRKAVEFEAQARAVVEERDRRIAELEQEIDRWKGHINEAGSLALQLTSRVEELEQELARERAKQRTTE
jgi:transcriptional regulator with XRE-family HTH domain